MGAQVQLKAPNGLWTEVSRTEVVQNDLNPQFKKKVEMDYTFETKQELKFILYDWWTPHPPPAARACTRSRHARLVYAGRRLSLPVPF